MSAHVPAEEHAHPTPGTYAKIGLILFVLTALEVALTDLGRRDEGEPHVLVLSGAGPSFCAGFDLGAVVEEPAEMASFLQRLSALNRALRRR